MDLTDEQCDKFRRLPCSFNDMVRAIYRAGVDAAESKTVTEVLLLIDLETAITGGGYHYHIAVPILKAAIKKKFGLER